MEHLSIASELDITSEIDFIVPLKQVGLITRAVLEAIYMFYKPRRIIVITARRECRILKDLVTRWDCGIVECIPEETFFIPNFSLTLNDLRAAYDYNRTGDQREPGWWIQQLIKLGAATQIKDISTTYIVWDGDLVPTRRWKLCERDEVTGEVRWYIAILQSESRSEFNSTQYAQCMESLTGFTPLEPQQGGGTFVTHHMVFNTKYVTELLDLMLKTTQSSLPWPMLIMSYSRKFYRFSEYKTYCTYMLRYHPDQFHYHDLGLFGEGGLRYREANDIIENLLAECPFSNGGLSYVQVKDFFFARYQSDDPANSSVVGVKPAYVQLDHVYGLDGVDLNLSGRIPASRETFSLRAFSQLKELTSVDDLPADLFASPVNVTVKRTAQSPSSPRSVDDSAIKRMTIGAAMKHPMNEQYSANRTTPRRPLQQIYYFGARQPSAASLINMTPSLYTPVTPPLKSTTAPTDSLIPSLFFPILPSLIDPTSASTLTLDSPSTTTSSSAYVKKPATAVVVQPPMIEIKIPWLRA